MKLSIIVPAYNSGDKIKELIQRIKKVPLGSLKKEIIVVDDCSKDNTYGILKKTTGIILIKNKRNLGKGGAVAAGFKKATGQILLIQDDDLEYDPFEIPQLLKPILQKRAQVVFGSRRLNKKNKYSSPLYYYGGVFVDSIISLILRSNTTDAITGAKVMTREAYEKIKPFETKGFEIEAEITAKVIKKKISLKEIPISYNPRTHQQGKNIRWHHAFPLLKALVKYSYFS